MIGNRVISLLTDAWVKASVLLTRKKHWMHTITKQPTKASGAPANGQCGWKEYFTLGYVPADKYEEATAKTLKYEPVVSVLN
jgi:putative alpha-1,2-mannosidase